MKLNMLALVVLSAILYTACVEKKEYTKNNVLFIMIDDLRPELNCFGASQIHSPSIDELASDGMVFTNSYCNVPVCGASRASLLSGLHPTPTRFVDYGARVDKEAPGVFTLPQHFKQNGYHTYSVGKIFHHPDDALQSWSESPDRPDYPNSLSQQELWRDYQSDENAFTKENALPLGAAGPAWEGASVHDTVYYDGKTTKRALALIDKLSADKPFFLGLGYIRPHLPFNAPKKYWDLYERSSIELPENYFIPEGVPTDALHNFGELRSYTNIKNDNNILDNDQVLSLRHGYYACVSYIDAQVGLVINKLKEKGLYDNTLIVLVGDHGWFLGEHTLWNKHSCLNDAVKTPLIIKAPGTKSGKKNNSLVSYVDLFPSICDMAGIDIPQHVAGKSLKPTLENSEVAVNEYVYCRWQNGESIKGKRYMYTMYFNEDGSFKDHMLFDHSNDPQENKNVVNAAENKEIVLRLRTALNEHLKSRKNKS